MASASSATHKLTTGRSFDKSFGKVATLTPTGDHTSTVIFMHGLGDSCDGWSSAVQQYMAPVLPNTKFVVPSAGNLPVTINGGMRMPAWYDIESLGADRATQKCAGMDDSRAYIEKLIEVEENAGIPRSRIVLGGFSQGAAMSLYAGLLSKRRLAGILAMSGYLARGEEVAANWGGDKIKDVPVFMAHGTADPVVQFAWGEASRDSIKAMGMANVQFKSYQGMAHEANDKELTDVVMFLTSVLKESPAGDSSAAAAEVSAAE